MGPESDIVANNPASSSAQQNNAPSRPAVNSAFQNLSRRVYTPSNGLNSTYLTGYVQEGGFGRQKAKAGTLLWLIGAAAIITLITFIVVWFPLMFPPHKPTTIWIVKYTMIADGAIIIIAGLIKFSRLQRQANLPVSKIDATANELSEVQGRIVPESGPQLISPLTKTPCVGYDITLKRLVTTRSGRQSNSEWIPVTSYGRALPTLITDGTGYMAFDFSNLRSTVSVSVNGTTPVPRYMRANTFIVCDANGKEIMFGSPICNSLLGTLNRQPEAIDPTTDGIVLKKHAGMQFTVGQPMSITEVTLPTDTDYFAMGRTMDTGKRLNDKPVKEMVYDAASDTLVFDSGTKRSADRIGAVSILAIIIIGLVMFASGAFLVFGQHSDTAAYVNSTVALTTVAPQGSTATTTQIQSGGPVSAAPCTAVLHSAGLNAPAQLTCNNVGAGLDQLLKQQNGEYSADFNVYVSGSFYEGTSTLAGYPVNITTVQNKTIQLEVIAIYPANQSAKVEIRAV